MTFASSYLNLIPALPLAGFLINAAIALGWARRGVPGRSILPALVGCLFPTASFLIALWGFWTLTTLPERTLVTDPLFSWMAVPLLEVRVSFLFDSLSSVMTLIVTGVGSLIHFYSIGYMKGDNGFARYFSYLNLFLFFMLLLVLGDNLLVLFVGWEGVGLCSYLLIGFWFTDPAKAACGKKAFVVNRIGDFGFLIGIFLVIYAFVSQSRSSEVNYLDFSFMAAHKEIFLPFATTIALCFFAGATGKSAQIPLYIWLPDAMAGPTPVSALIHAATMVTAGVYMVARLFFLFALSPVALEVVMTIGMATALLAAVIALVQTDIKKVLAYSTVSQLGFMFLGLGVGAPISAIFHVATHAFFKACLFLGAGAVITALHHEQDIRKMGGLAGKMPLVFTAFLLATLAIAGIPPFAGFFSKDEILWNVWLGAPHLVYGMAVFTAGLTSFYMVRLLVYVFFGAPRFHECHAIPRVMTGVILVLGLLSLVGGWIGLPTVFGWKNYFHDWLGATLPSVAAEEGHHAEEVKLMMIATAWSLASALAAFFLYWRNLGWTTFLKGKIVGSFYRLAERKFFVDELYDFLVIRPVAQISRVFLWKMIDQRLIDGLLVHGWGGMAGLGARVLSRVQTGVLGHYLVYLWLGLASLLVLVLR